MTAEPAPAGLDELYRVSQVVLSVTRQMAVRDVLQVIVQSARSLVGARYAALGIPDAHGSFGEFMVDGISDRQWRAIGPLPRQHGMLGVLLREARPERLADIRTDPRFEGGWPSAHPDLSGFLGVPVKDGGEVLAIIFAANKVVPEAGPGTGAGADPGPGPGARRRNPVHRPGRGTAVPVRRARRHRPDQRPAVGAQPGAVGAGGTLPAGGRPARRGVAEAVQPPGPGPRGRGAGRPGVRARAGGPRPRWKRSRQLGAEAQAELRAVIDGLAPPELGEAGLAESLRRYAVLAGRAHAVTVEFRRRAARAGRGAGGGAVPGRPGGTAQRAAACGRRPDRVELSRSPRRVILEVTDDGAGFAPGAPGGLGFASMRGRARAAVGGTLTIRSAPGAGTTVRLALPLRRTARGGEARRG